MIIIIIIIIICDVMAEWFKAWEIPTGPIHRFEPHLRHSQFILE